MFLQPAGIVKLPEVFFRKYVLGAVGSSNTLEAHIC